MRRAHVLILVSGIVVAVGGSAAAADIYDHPENLEVLPRDISSADLRKTMRNFSFDLGLGCADCHVGEDGQPFETFDFPADDKERKRIARLMMRMVRDLNGHRLAALDRPADERVEVRCATCHRGQPKPLLMTDALMIAYRQGGVPEAVSRYRALKADYFGSDTYDFTETARLSFAERLALGEKDPAGAIAFLADLHDEYGASFMTDVKLGELHVLNQDLESAVAAYEAALKGAPAGIQDQVRARLDGLKQTTSGANQRQRERVPEAPDDPGTN